MKSILALFFILVCPLVLKAESTILLQDNFHTKDANFYNWLTLGTGQHVSSPNGVAFVIPKNSPPALYNDSTLFGKQFFNKANLDMAVKSGPFAGGSRGWGFWNGEQDPMKAEFAIFIYSNGKGYNLNGFYTLTKEKGKAIEAYPLPLAFLSKEHIYSVRWTANAVEFNIDQDRGCVNIHRTSVPQGNLAVDIWSDSAVWDFSTFSPLLQPILDNSFVEIRSLKVFR